MLEIFKGIKREEGPKAPTEVSQLTLDELWHGAERLGRIEVDHAIGDSAYRVRIRFYRRSGSMVWAECKHTDITFAMYGAIQEALSLGADPYGR